MPYGEDTFAIRGKQVRLWRSGTGAPVLYLHDTFCYEWMPVHDRLAAHYDVLVPLHPGCAGSDGFESIDTMEDLVFHYLDVCDALRLPKPVLLGPSLGGWLAAELAIRYAEKFRALILVDALGLRLSEAPATDLLRLDAAQMRAAVFADPHSPAAYSLIPDVPPQDTMRHYLQSRQLLARFAWQFPDNPKLTNYLYRVTVPTLIVWGEHDTVVPLAHARAYRDGIPQAELVVLPRCGHLPQAEQPAALADTLLTYLARLPR